MCPSWRQACITPDFCDGKETPLSSSMGKASMSARRAMTGEPEPIVATTPVFATGYLQHI